MDSLTQIVLGAAVGETVLGKKIGNRAMVWGAIGGTIPDLDIIANFFMEPIPALAFHRGITHSLLFSIVMAFLLAWLVHKLYQTHTHQKLWYKLIVGTINIVLLSGLFFGLYLLFGKPIWMIPVLGFLWVYLLWRLYRFYLSKTLEEVTVSYGRWYLLFFLALSTHFLLDCFTSFGTQVFLPFSDYRVAFNTIAVVDPLYTVPFMICLIIASNINRQRRARQIANWTAIILSSSYLLFTVFNKLHVDSVFEKAIAHRQLDVERCRTSPTILTNFLWNCVAESDSVYYVGLYSNFDSDPNLHYLNVIPKNTYLATEVKDLSEYKTLQWFSDGYLIHQQTDSALILSDIRFGGMRDTISSHRDLVFNFFAVKNPDGSYSFSEKRERPENPGAELRKLWKRMWGKTTEGEKARR